MKELRLAECLGLGEVDDGVLEAGLHERNVEVVAEDGSGHLHGLLLAGHGQGALSVDVLRREEGEHHTASPPKQLNEIFFNF